jgi:radical SAM superfamily enzyme YgiQ (UPF0313 family)
MTQLKRNVLLLYPEFPKTFWGMQYALPVLGKKALMPPLGLITLAAMCPPEFEFRLVDTNCRPLSEEDLRWADMVCISAMLPQKKSLFPLTQRCLEAGKLVVLGGPYPTSSPEECAPWCDVIVANEAEITWPMFLEDLRRGTLKRFYGSDEKPDLTSTPVPRFDLLEIQHYMSIPIQFSRGCPFRCEFCDIIVLFGRKPRTKTPQQVIAELEAVKRTGYRGEIFIVDDNFIGNKREVKRLLPVLEAWNTAHGAPFEFGTEASVDLAREEELLGQMVRAGFRWVFLGIETPSEESLKETLKYQNTRAPLTEAVDRILRAGLFVTAGFIIGFDSDDESIFQRQIDFIRRSAIPFSMVGLLVAVPGTPLYDRMQATGRLEGSPFGNNDHCGHTNIRTKIPKRRLIEAYRQVLAHIFAPENYFQRAFDTSRRFRPATSLREGLGRLLRSFRSGKRFFVTQGNRQGAPRLEAWTRLRAFWELWWALPSDFRRNALRLGWRLLKTRYDLLGGVLDYTVVGYHLNRFAFQEVIPQLDAQIRQMRAEEEAGGEGRVYGPHSPDLLLPSGEGGERQALVRPAPSM